MIKTIRYPRGQCAASCLDAPAPPRVQPTQLDRLLRRARIALTGLVLAAVAACGGDSPSGPNDLGQLSEVEAVQLLSALMNAYALAPSLPGFTGPAPQRQTTGSPALVAVPTVTITVDTVQATGNCPVGGTVSVMGRDSVRIEEDLSNPGSGNTFAGTAGYSGRSDITTQYQSCRSQDSQGNTWEFNTGGGLRLVFDYDGRYDVNYLNGSSTVLWDWDWDGRWTGSFDWSSQFGSGTCQVDVRWTVTNTVGANGQAAGTSQQTGHVCGVNITT